MKCQGRCNEYGECKGTIRAVNVISENGCRNWGDYNYCETAIEHDQDNGFLVYENDKIVLTNYLLAKRARMLLDSLEGCHVATLNRPLKKFIDGLMTIDECNQLRKL